MDIRPGILERSHVDVLIIDVYMAFCGDMHIVYCEDRGLSSFLCKF